MNYGSKALFFATTLLLIAFCDSKPLVTTTTCCINGAVTCNDQDMPNLKVMMMEADRGISKAFSWLDRDDLVAKIKTNGDGEIEQTCGYANDSNFNPHAEIYLWTKATCGDKLQCYRYDIQDCSETGTQVNFALDEAHIAEDGCDKFEKWTEKSVESESGENEEDEEDELDEDEDEEIK